MDSYLYSFDVFEKIIISATLTFLSALLITAFFIPKVNDLGFKLNVIDNPNNRKQHKKIIVRLGGLGIFLGFLIAALSSTLIGNLLNNNFFDIYKILIIMFGGFCFFLLGISDDFRAKSPYLKLFIQIIIASLMYALNIKFDALDISFLNFGIDFLILPNWLAYMLSVLWIVGITNSMNWLDGLDGLASGISIIISSGLLLIFFYFGQFDLAFILISLSGASMGFLRFNFYPAKILMGDGGSFFLGGLLSLVSLNGLSSINPELELLLLPVHIIIFIFLIPIVDLTFVTISRLIEGKSPFNPDRRHIHHKLLEMELSHRDTVIFLYGISQLFMAIAVYLSGFPGRVFILCFSFLTLVLCLLYCKNMKKRLDKSYLKE